MLFSLATAFTISIFAVPPILSQSGQNYDGAYFPEYSRDMDYSEDRLDLELHTIYDKLSASSQQEYRNLSNYRGIDFDQSLNKLVELIADDMQIMSVSLDQNWALASQGYNVPTKAQIIDSLRNSLLVYKATGDYVRITGINDYTLGKLLEGKLVGVKINDFSKVFTFYRPTREAESEIINILNLPASSVSFSTGSSLSNGIVWFPTDNFK